MDFHDPPLSPEDKKGLLPMETDSFIAHLALRDGTPHFDDIADAIPGQYQSLVKLEFIAEGAANVLFSINTIQSPGSPQSPQDDQKHAVHLDKVLLRLRKCGFLPEVEASPPPPPPPGSVPPPPFVSSQEIYNFIETRIRPEFKKDDLVNYVLVTVSSKILDECNLLLSNLEASKRRLAKRQGWYINRHQEHGLLVTDMRPLLLQQPDGDSMTLEFKPKWLAQSPVAPSTARRCRTCAWHANTRLPAHMRYCPLALASGKAVLVDRQLRRFLPAESPAGRALRSSSSSSSSRARWDFDHVVRQIALFFCDPERGAPMLERLRALQRRWDPHGMIERLGVGEDDYVLLGSSSSSSSSRSPKLVERAKKALADPANGGFEDLAAAMTARDCIVLVRLSRERVSGKLVIEGRLADLDLKKVDVEKLLKWTLDEKRLVFGGFYEGKEDMQLKSEGYRIDHEKEICMLWTEERRKIIDDSS